MRYVMTLSFLVLAITQTNVHGLAVDQPIPGISSNISQPKNLALKEGRLTYEDSAGSGPVLLCIPGLGDTRGQYRLLSPLLAARGYRVIVVDPRGQGDSEASFASYSSRLVGEDIVQLIDQLGVEVFLIGNSSGGASAAWIASQRSTRVRGIVFIDAFLRDHPMGLFTKVMLEAALRSPWATSFWISYYNSLFTSHPPTDQQQYTDSLRASLQRDGHISALRRMIFSSKADVESKLKDINTPVLAIAGTKDPDFDKPEDELDWILSVLPGDKALIDGAGHYPHLEYPEKIADLIEKFLSAHLQKGMGTGSP